MSDDYVWTGWEPEPSEEQKRYWETGQYPDEWVHEHNNLGSRTIEWNENPDKPIWGRDGLGNKVLVGYEEYEPGEARGYYVPHSTSSLSTTLLAGAVIAVVSFIVLFMIAQGLEAFGEASGIAPMINGALGLR